MLAISIVVYIAATLAIGFWASKRVKTTNDFTLKAQHTDQSPQLQ